MTPVRIRLSRAKGWRKPPGTVVVSRPGRWGNPFPVGQHAYTDEVRALAIAEFRKHLVTGQLRVTVDDVRRELRGKSLCCWCPLNKACHADVLLEIANS